MGSTLQEADGQPSSAAETPLTEVPGQAVREAQQLLAAANRALEAAVIVERTRNTSWEEIGDALGGVTRSTAHGRFASAVDAAQRRIASELQSGTGDDLGNRIPQAASRKLDEAWSTVAELALSRAARAEFLALSGEVHQTFSPWKITHIALDTSGQRVDDGPRTVGGTRYLRRDLHDPRSADLIVRDGEGNVMVAQAKHWPESEPPQAEHAHLEDVASALLEAAARLNGSDETRPLANALIRTVREDEVFTARLRAARNAAAHDFSSWSSPGLSSRAVMGLSFFLEHQEQTEPGKPAGRGRKAGKLPEVGLTELVAAKALRAQEPDPRDKRLDELEQRIADLESLLRSVAPCP